MNISLNTLTSVAAASVLFGLALVSLASPSMAQQQTTADTTTATPSPNATTTISVQDLTNNQTVTEQFDGFTITQQWSPRIFISPGTAEISHASCSEGQVVIGGGFQTSNPEVTLLINGPSLAVNAYAVQAYNGDDSASSIQVYAICVGGTG